TTDRTELFSTFCMGSLADYHWGLLVSKQRMGRIGIRRSLFYLGDCLYRHARFNGDYCRQMDEFGTLIWDFTYFIWCVLVFHCSGSRPTNLFLGDAGSHVFLHADHFPFEFPFLYLVEKEQ